MQFTTNQAVHAPVSVFNMPLSSTEFRRLFGKKVNVSTFSGCTFLQPAAHLLPTGQSLVTGDAVQLTPRQGWTWVKYNRRHDDRIWRVLPAD